MNFAEGDIFPVWTVHRNNDDRASGSPTEICTTSALAQQIAHRSGNWGGDAPTEQRWAILARGKAYLLVDDEPIRLVSTLEEARLGQRELLKKQGLAKLSADEREALGLR